MNTNFSIKKSGKRDCPKESRGMQNQVKEPPAHLHIHTTRVQHPKFLTHKMTWFKI